MGRKVPKATVFRGIGFETRTGQGFSLPGPAVFILRFEGAPDSLSGPVYAFLIGEGIHAQGDSGITSPT